MEMAEFYNNLNDAVKSGKTSDIKVATSGDTYKSYVEQSKSDYKALKYGVVDFELLEKVESLGNYGGSSIVDGSDKNTVQAKGNIEYIQKDVYEDNPGVLTAGFISSLSSESPDQGSVGIIYLDRSKPKGTGQVRLSTFREEGSKKISYFNLHSWGTTASGDDGWNYMPENKATDYLLRNGRLIDKAIKSQETNRMTIIKEYLSIIVRTWANSPR